MNNKHEEISALHSTCTPKRRRKKNPKLKSKLRTILLRPVFLYSSVFISTRVGACTTKNRRVCFLPSQVFEWKPQILLSAFIWGLLSGSWSNRVAKRRSANLQSKAPRAIESELILFIHFQFLPRIVRPCKYRRSADNCDDSILIDCCCSDDHRRYYTHRRMSCLRCRCHHWHPYFYCVDEHYRHQSVLWQEVTLIDGYHCRRAFAQPCQNTFADGIDNIAGAAAAAAAPFVGYSVRPDAVLAAMTHFVVDENACSSFASDF